MRTRILLLCAASAFIAQRATAQVPNGGFEDWVNVDSYQDPSHWITSNSLTDLGVQPLCEQGSPGAVGAHYAKLTTRLISGIGAYPSIMVSTNEDSDEDGFPISGHPAALTGQWQYGIQANDIGNIAVVLFKYDPVSHNRATVAVGQVQATGTLSSWQPFSAELTYITGDQPDTAIITMESSSGSSAAGSFLLVDDLHLGDATGITEQDALPSLRTYPSPATDVLHVAADVAFSDIVVTDLTGRTVLTRSANAVRADLDVNALPAGRYFLQVRLADGARSVRSFVKD